jgi:heme-degrading monooxygenase HmoA
MIDEIDGKNVFMDRSENDPIIAFTLARYPRRTSLSGLAHLGLDRLPLWRTPGLRFWRLLGVGKGKAFDPHADLQRYALFTVWDSLADLRRFEVHSAMMQRIQRRADEVWTVHMRPVRWHGKWGGSDPFAHIAAVPPPDPGPWIILTRATIRPTKVRSFLDAVPTVAEHLLQQQELINSVGVGEAPLFYQATLSIWSSLPAVTSFAYGPTPHIAVVRRTRQEGWYSEELFARFRPVASYGTWDNVNPLPGLI